ncbi:MAG: hypothetical protein D6705_02655 [Deltaproteobacteria bacterium]|nr:MAG: hypothetical protein D6705_02655 [Deltaproteobacteria bacterium]
MERRVRRRIAVFVAVLPVAVLLFALVYMVGMDHLEGRPRTFGQAVVWASETLTSTGYGGDSRWSHPLMIAYVALVQFVGITLLFVSFPLYVIPYIEERFEGRLPRTVPRKLRDYVLVYRWGPEVEGLHAALVRADVPCVVFEEDESTARRLADRGLTVVFGDVEDDDVPDEVVRRARAMVLNGSDADNGAFVWSARNAGFDGDIHAFMAEPRHRGPMLRAGATSVYTPQHVLAAALAAAASERISPRISGVRRLGGGLEVQELRIDAQSPLAGRSLSDARIRERTGATVIALWREGRFDPCPRPDARLSPGTIILVLGTPDAIERLSETARPLRRTGPIFVLGHGEVGRKVVELLADADESVCVVDRRPDAGADVVADALDADALERAGIADARAVVLCLESDATTAFAAAMVRDLAPDAAIVARVDRPANVVRVHRAGADFAVSIGQVAGEILVQHLLGDQAAAHEQRVRIVERPGRPLAGRTPAELRLRETCRTNLVAIRRAGRVVTDVDPNAPIEPDDVLVLAATSEGLRAFDARYGSDAGSGRPA